MSTEKEKVADSKLIGYVWPWQKTTAVKYDLFVCLFLFSLFRDTLCHSFDPVETKMWCRFFNCQNEQCDLRKTEKKSACLILRSNTS